MIVKTKIIMDLLKPTLCPVINAVQGDTYSRGIDISLFAAGVAWEIPDDVTAAVRYRKRDGTKGYYDTLPDGSAAWSAANNVLTVLLAPQMLTVAGPVVTQIEMIQGAKVLATFSMRLFVEENPAAGVLESEDYINWLQWMEAELDAYLEKAKVNGEYVGGKMLGPINMDGHTLSGLNAPTANDQAANKGYVDGAVKTARPRNLLGNSDFINLIAQAGFLGYHGTRTYLADRWSININLISYDSTNRIISFGRSDSPVIIKQTVPDNLSGKTVTLAIKASSVTGNVRLSESGAESGHADVNITDGITVHTFVGGESTSVLFWSKEDASLCIDWIALYEGEYTADTVQEPHQEDYIVNLMACLVYFHLYATEAARPSHGLDCSPPMRIDAVTQGTLEIDGVTYYYNSADL